MHISFLYQDLTKKPIPEGDRLYLWLNVGVRIFRVL